MNTIEEKAKSIISQFKIDGTLVKLKTNTQGHINNTFVSTFEKDCNLTKYTHQLINKNVFKHPDQVMDNIIRVTNHIKNKISALPDADKRVLEVILTKEELPYYLDNEGNYWRTYKFIDDVDTFDTIKDENKAYELGKAVGQFQLQLSDFDGSTLYTTIEHFHDMVLRYGQLDAALLNNYQNRKDLIKEELQFLADNRERGYALWKGFENGFFPSRVTHNDTKMNNVLFDKKTSEGLCVIDLDTIMPGTALFDTGDMIRTACNTGGEDEKDLSKIEFNVPYYKALIKGYREKADSFLTENEKNYIKESGRIITQIMAVRFIADYLNGDVYYHTEYPEHNIVRAKTQIKLMQSMDAQWDLF